MEFFWGNAFKIAVLLNPFAVLSTFIALAGSRPVRERVHILAETSIAVILGGVLFLFSGDMMFSLMDINLDLFKVGGGTVLMVCSISLVWGKERRNRNFPGSSIAVVPLAVPMALGPGTAAGLVVIGAEQTGSLTAGLANTGALCAGVSVLACILSLGIWAERILNPAVVSIITRLTGLFLSAIAAKMILEGIKSALSV